MNWQGKTVLITGISGFVGPYLAKRALALGATVYGFTRRRSDGVGPRRLSELGIAREVKLLEGDITDITAIGSALDVAKPDIVFHMAAQSDVARSFVAPQETLDTNVGGTAKLLEAIRVKGARLRLVFAGSSEEYGPAIPSAWQEEGSGSASSVTLPPARAYELPISETTPLRPVSPYGVSKVMGDHLVRTYAGAYGIDGVVSRAFNHEGAGRGSTFVTSTIVRQVMGYKLKETDRITIGNVNAFRDWSHVEDAVGGYCLLAGSGRKGAVYNLGSGRTNSVISYILVSLEAAGYRIESLETMRGGKAVPQPTERDYQPFFGLQFEKTKLDRLMLEGEIVFRAEDEGIWINTPQSRIPIQFDIKRFRPVEVPILLANTEKAKSLGFRVNHSIADIISDQMNYFLDSAHRSPSG